MVTMPLMVLLGIGIYVSVTRGKGKTALLFGVMCLLEGLVIANTQVGRLLADLLTGTAQQLAASWS